MRKNFIFPFCMYRYDVGVFVSCSSVFVYFVLFFIDQLKDSARTHEVNVINEVLGHLRKVNCADI